MFLSARRGSRRCSMCWTSSCRSRSLCWISGRDPDRSVSGCSLGFLRRGPTAVEIDPVMLAIGRGALGTINGRLRWVQADLESPDWRAALGDETRFDAVLSSTALHWLWPDPLVRLYHDLGQMLRPGGVLLNADHMAFGEALPTFARVSDRALESQWTDAAFAARGIETAEQSWDDLGGEAALATLLAERASRFDGKQRQASPPGFDAHIAALRDAGFREMGTTGKCSPTGSCLRYVDTAHTSATSPHRV